MYDIRDVVMNNCFGMFLVITAVHSANALQHLCFVVHAYYNVSILYP